MNRLFTGFVPRVFRIRIQGLIQRKLAQSVANGIEKSWPYRPEAFILTINSPGGSLVQTKNIADLLRVHSHKLNIPIITFAEDQCIGSANLLLTLGVKSYAHQYSLIGDIGYVWNRIWFKKLNEKYNIKQQFIQGGQNKIKMNPFDDFTPEDAHFIQHYGQIYERELREAISYNRREPFIRQRTSPEQQESKIFKAGIIQPESAVKLGFLDGLKTFDEEIADRYSSSKVREVNKAKFNLREELKIHF